MSALTVVETDLACDRAKNHSRQSLGHPIGRSVAPGKISPKTVSYPRIHRARVSTPPRARAAPAAPAAPANDAKHSHSLVSPPPARPSARPRAPTRAHARAREIRYASAPAPRSRASRDASAPRRASARRARARKNTHLDLGRLEGGDAADEGGSEKGRHCRDVRVQECRSRARDRAIDRRDRRSRSTSAFNAHLSPRSRARVVDKK
jgi:hypothetical protein